MFHVVGRRFDGIESVRRDIATLEKRWNYKVAPAIVKYAKESGKDGPKSDDINSYVNSLIFISLG